MQRCVHLYGSGRQCASDVVPGTDLCEDHAITDAMPDGLVDHPIRKLALRLVALILLLVFLLPVYYTMKALYGTVPVELQEGP